MATRAELIKLHQRLQTTIVYVTHDQVEAMTMGTRIAVMRDGVLQQLDTPQNLYNHPANTFVAGFIGSPAMNFFEAGVTVSDGDARIQGDGFGFGLSGNRARFLAAYNRKEVLLGIRPEHLSESSDGETEREGELAALVEVVESMGSEQQLYLGLGSKSFVAKVDGFFQVKVRDKVRLAFPKEQLRLFDPQSEMSIPSVEDGAIPALPLGSRC